MRIRKHDTRVARKMKNLICLQKQGHAPFSNRLLKKSLKDAARIHKGDEEMNDFLRYFSLMPSGGEYVMPASHAKGILDDIYGTEPSIQVALSAGEHGPEGDVFDRLEKMRRKPDPAVARTTRRTSTTRNINKMANMAGKKVGTIPREALVNMGRLGVQGGSAVGSTQDMWVSGASIGYDFDVGVTKI